METRQYEIAVVGCGVVGAAIARQLSQYQLSVCILEKENDVAVGTTKANSAIIHAGYDPRPGSLMAKLNARGVELVKELAPKLHFPYQPIGSLILAFTEENRKTVEVLYQRGRHNGVPGLQILSAEEVREMEPNISPEVKGALYAPSAGIVSPWRMALAFAESAVRNGVALYRNSPVTGIAKTGEGYELTTPSGVVRARYVINATGVDAFATASLLKQPPYEMRPNRGEYYLFDKCAGETVHHVIFQCPTEVGKGVLVSPTVDGNLIVGPNAEPVEGAQDTGTTAEGLVFVKKMAMLSVPGLSFRDSIRNFAGVRANTNLDDFQIRWLEPGFLDVAGIKSPGLSSAPAIGEYVAELLMRDGVKLLFKKEFQEELPERVHFKELSPEEKAEVVRKNPLYGRIICRCETVTEGEMVDALHSPIPPVSIDGIKRRCGAGMGRCQGGFCGPRVHEIISRETGLPMEAVMQDRAGMVIVTGETKTGAGGKQEGEKHHEI